MWQQPRNPPCACSKQPIVIKDRRRCGMPRNISVQKSTSDQVKEQSMLGTAGIAKTKEPNSPGATADQPILQPTHNTSCQSSASNRSQFDLLRNPSNGKLPHRYLRHREALCVWVLLLARSWQATSQGQSIGMCVAQVTQPLELRSATKAWLAASSTGSCYCSVKFMCDSCAFWLSCKFCCMAVTCLFSSACSGENQ